jgi:hypothetical protein
MQLPKQSSFKHSKPEDCFAFLLFVYEHDLSLAITCSSAGKGQIYKPATVGRNDDFAHAAAFIWCFPQNHLLLIQAGKAPLLK